jgi:3-oxoacyl-[acyl-carrier-protein] synthase-3
MHLRDIAFAVPETRVASDEVARWTGLDPQFIAEKIGVESRAFLRADETPVDLARRACEALFLRAQQLDPRRLRLLVVVTQNPDFKLPHDSALLQHALSLPAEIACFDVNLGCSGYVYALSIARALMATEEIGDALVVTCDAYSRIMGRNDRDTVALFGDAASATWLSAETGGRIGRLDFGTDGSGAEHLIVPAGGAAQPLSSVHGERSAEVPSDALRLHMNGRAIFNFMMERVPVSLERCLDRNGVTREQVDFFVFHQASRFLLETLARRLRLPADRVPINIAKLGNTVSSTIPIVLAELLAEGRLTGKRVLVSGFGVGLSWATNIIEF